MSVVTEWVRYGNEGQYSGFAARLEAVREPQPAVLAHPSMRSQRALPLPAR